MKVLLVNNNQVVQKLIDVTTRKVDCELTTFISFQEFKNESDVKKYDLVVFDQEILEGYQGDFAFLEGLRSIILYSQVSQDDALLSHFTYSIKKPFLPNEFLSFLVGEKQSLKEKKKEEFAKLDEKEMFANIDAEDEGTEDDDLNQLLKDLDISTDDSGSLKSDANEDDLDALLQSLPEEDEIKEEGDKQQAEPDGEQSEIETELEENQGNEEQEDFERLDEIEESDVKPQQNVSEEEEVLDEQETGTLEDMGQAEIQESEEEDDETDGLLDEGNEENGEVEKENHSVGGALDLAEIAKVQNLLDEVQKSGGKVGGESFGELDLLQNLLSSRSPEGIREILDGMQLTINISFPKKEH